MMMSFICSCKNKIGALLQFYKLHTLHLVREGVAIGVGVEVSHDDRKREAVLCSPDGHENLHTHVAALELRFARPLARLCFLAVFLALGLQWV